LNIAHDELKVQQVREFAQVFHIGAIIELIQNDNLCVNVIADVMSNNASDSFLRRTFFKEEQEQGQEQQQILSTRARNLAVQEIKKRNKKRGARQNLSMDDDEFT
jgi:hypothetical protein